MDSSTLLIAETRWSQERERLSEIRRRVFIEEQQVPESLEWDSDDEAAIHYLASLENKAIACARLKNDGQIGRMAVLASYRNQGIGSAVLHYILNSINQEQLKTLYLHAQVSAISFYEKAGFITDGDIFYEADIPHVKMVAGKALTSLTDNA